MDDLQWDLKKLTKQHREDSIGTQLARHQSLDLIARQLKEMGYRNLRAESLKPKHVEALVRRWQGEGLSVGTQKKPPVPPALVGGEDRQARRIPACCQTPQRLSLSIAELAPHVWCLRPCLQSLRPAAHPLRPPTQ